MTPTLHDYILQTSNLFRFLSFTALYYYSSNRQGNGHVTPHNLTLIPKNARGHNLFWPRRVCYVLQTGFDFQGLES